MIAAGTGIAPFIGFIQEREFLSMRGHQLGKGKRVIKKKSQTF